MTTISSAEITDALTSYTSWPTDPTGEWFVDPTGEWLFNSSSNMAYHSSSDVLYISQERENNQLEWIRLSQPTDMGTSHTTAQVTDSSAALYNENEHTSMRGADDEKLMTGETDDDASSDIMIDLETSLQAATACLKSNAPNKQVCEDRYVTMINLPTHLFSSDKALCYYFAVFDGHAGSDCAEYVEKHLHNNILSIYSQSIGNLKRENAGKQLFRKRAKCRSELDMLIHSCKKSFEVTDKNYLDICKRKGNRDGSTACVVLLYGPDNEGELKAICAHAGDSRAVLCRDGIALRLTEDHKPNRNDEVTRIQRAGGKVTKLNGIWRAGVGIKQAATETFFGLSVSRGFGDITLKVPSPIISPEPEVVVHDIYFDSDEFMVLGSDGIFDVLTDQVVVEMVRNNLHLTPDEVAELIVKTAGEAGSTDDKTCTVVYFRWNHIFGDMNEESMEEDTEKVVEGVQSSFNEEIKSEMNSINASEATSDSYSLMQPFECNEDVKEPETAIDSTGTKLEKAPESIIDNATDDDELDIFKSN